MKLKSLLVAAALLIFGSAESANALTFNLSGSTLSQSSFSVTGDDGLTGLTVTGLTSGGTKNVHLEPNRMGFYKGG